MSYINKLMPEDIKLYTSYVNKLFILAIITPTIFIPMEILLYIYYPSVFDKTWAILFVILINYFIYRKSLNILETKTEEFLIIKELHRRDDYSDEYTPIQKQTLKYIKYGIYLLYITTTFNILNVVIQFIY